MPITVADLIADPGLFAQLSLPAESCASCGITIQETITGRHKTSSGVLCSDDFFSTLGEELEKHPIASGAVRRG
jgi:hypothetical protein